MSERRGKKRPKSYYIKCANKRPRTGHALGPGMRGFLATCNNNERGAVRELYNILNEYADELYGPEEPLKAKDDQKAPAGAPEAAAAGDAGNEEDSEEEDLEKAMAEELSSMREAAQCQRRFQNTQTSAKNCIFIQTTLERPDQLAQAVFQDLWEKKVQKTRFAVRMLPIQGTCKAQIDSMTKLAEAIFPPFFSEHGGVSYSINVKVRNNNSGLGRESIIPKLGGVVQELSLLNHVDHNAPDFVILVEVVRNVCCLGVVKSYTKFRKYNLIEVGKDKPVELETNAGGDNHAEQGQTTVTDNSRTEKGSAEEEEVGTDAGGNADAIEQKEVSGKSE